MHGKGGKWKDLRLTLLVVDVKTSGSESNLLCVDGYLPIFQLDRFYGFVFLFSVCFVFFFLIGNWVYFLLLQYIPACVRQGRRGKMIMTLKAEFQFRGSCFPL